ncbi:MAG TPA: hypothetical protein VMF52_12260 [Steroidobacteraceae bacterium]|nr:hypothetical protein [Steroidobacteraceae bacterium]
MTPLPDRLTLLPGDWQPLGPDAAALLLQRMDAYTATTLAGEAFSRRVRLRQAWWQPLEFYPGFTQISAEILEQGHLAWFDALCGPGLFWCMDGQPHVLHGLNDGTLRTGDARQPTYPRALIRLSPSRAARAYLRLFVHALRERDVTFRIVESVRGLRALGVATAEAYTRQLQPLRLSWRDREHTALRATAAMVYAGSLFKCRFELSPDGRVDMLQDEPLSPGRIVDPERCDLWLRDIHPLQTSALLDAPAGVTP